MSPHMKEVSDLSDEQIVGRVLAGETDLYEVIMRRYNQRLYRIARAIVGSADEAEDIIQDAYVRAYANLRQFAGEAKFATWLTKIAIYEALARSRRSKRNVENPGESGEEHTMETFAAKEPNPEVRASESELRGLLESAIDELPDTYRSVFVLREIEGLSTAEAAQCLDVTEESIKVRLHRSRRMLRHTLYERAGVASTTAFAFLGARCDNIVHTVMERIRTERIL